MSIRRNGLAKTNVVLTLANTIGIMALSVAATQIWRDVNARPPLPRLLAAPTVVGPEHDRTAVISDDQLFEVLDKLQPKLNQQQPKINFVDHALRFWGADVEFESEESLSGSEMRDLLLDHHEFQKSWGRAARPLLYADPEGQLQFRTQQGRATASHTDHTLGTIAEIGTRLDRRIVYAGGESTVESLLQDALHRFSLNQAEYEWTCVALALYAADATAWYTSEGQEITFDRITRRIMRQQAGKGVCFGQHRLYTLALILRIDEQKSLLSPSARLKAESFLKEMTARLVNTQHADGFWDANWPDEGQAIREKTLTPLARRLSATGHSLEWWAISDCDLHPPRETIVRAGQWLVREVEKLDDAAVQENYTFLTHIGRALCLWRGELPAEAWRRLTAQSRAGGAS